MYVFLCFGPGFEESDNTNRMITLAMITICRCCTRWGRIPNEQIKADLGVYNISDRIGENKSQWKQHIDRMDPHKLPKVIKN